MLLQVLMYYQPVKDAANKKKRRLTRQLRRRSKRYEGMEEEFTPPVLTGLRALAVLCGVSEQEKEATYFIEMEKEQEEIKKQQKNKKKVAMTQDTTAQMASEEKEKNETCPQLAASVAILSALSPLPSATSPFSTTSSPSSIPSSSSLHVNTLSWLISRCSSFPGKCLSNYLDSDTLDKLSKLLAIWLKRGDRILGQFLRLDVDGQTRQLSGPGFNRTNVWGMSLCLRISERIFPSAATLPISHFVPMLSRLSLHLHPGIRHDAHYMLSLLMGKPVSIRDEMALAPGLIPRGQVLNEWSTFLNTVPMFTPIEEEQEKHQLLIVDTINMVRQKHDKWMGSRITSDINLIILYENVFCFV